MKLIKEKTSNILRIVKNCMMLTHDTDKSVNTSKGIAVGHSLEEVKKKYGDDFSKRQEQGAEIIVYKDDNKYIEFWLCDNKVQEIRFGKKYIS